MAGKLTERRAAKAARQLLHHRERLAWMEERMAENATVLESFLVALGEERAVLPGGYVLSRDEKGGGAPVEVRRIAAEDGFEQLRLEA
ncbi:MAG: hypothetical protein M3R38_14295 [Actinomycetota bacterium]|nr:hypothetical protein [Actinomycetota bacterium]